MLQKKKHCKMRFAIISAGEGSRLSQEGVLLPKPMVQLNGCAMIDRLIQIFGRCGASEIVIIINIAWDNSRFFRCCKGSV